jgi:aminopeptidase N
MKKTELTLLFVILVFCGFAQKPDVAFFDKIALQEQTNFKNKSAFVESGNYNLTDFVYQRMEWEIDPDTLFIKGVITTWFKSKTQNLNEVEFDLHDTLIVDSVTHKNVKLAFQRTQNKLIVTLAHELNEEQLDSVSVYYRGTPPATGSGAFTKTIHEEVPNIWTLSEPYGAMEWWPCKQSLVDKIDSIDIIVTSPEAYRTASNGVLVSETVVAGKRRMHWKHRFPVATYLIAISVTNYSNYSDFLELGDGRKIEILNYVYPENLEDAKLKTPFTADVIALYNELIGEYPFASEKYGHAQFGWGGGMEHQTMSFMGSFNPWLVAHELAHQWFGDYITLGSWQDIWLNEGFATFLTGLSYERLIDDGFWWPRWKRVNVERIVSEPDGSVFVKDTTDVGAIFSGRLSYSKGAYILHMLRWILGDEDFFRGIRSYFNDPEVANGFARTSQFVKHMETAGDTTLTEFFNDWFYGEGFPVYSARFLPEEMNSTKIVLSQTTSHQSVGFFEMPVPVRVYNSAKTDSADFRLVNTNNNQEFIVEPGFKVAELKIDPDYWLVSKTEEIVSSPVVAATNKMSVFPNPFSGNISIQFNKNVEIISIKIVSVDGLIVKKILGNKRSLNLSGLSEGVYVLRIKTKSGHFEQRIIKQ